MEESLFSSGDIYLLKNRLDGRCGARRMMAMLAGGALIGQYSGGEIWVCALSKDASTLMIFHLDNYGFSLTKRKLHNGRFKVLLEREHLIITVPRLRRLCLDGTVQGQRRNPALKLEESLKLRRPHLQKAA